MKDSVFTSTNRIEAFSDGIIAIIITVMVFDLKLSESSTTDQMYAGFIQLLPKFASYVISFLMLAIMWVNHHQLFHQIKHADRKLLWLSIHLLFWMSFIPFSTHFVGMHPDKSLTVSTYSLNFLMCVVSFSMLRAYIIRNDFLHEQIDRKMTLKIRKKNYLAISMYGLAAICSLLTVTISYVFILIVPLMYIIPERIVYKENAS